VNSTKSKVDAIVESVSRTGVTQIRFTQLMHVPSNWTDLQKQDENDTYNETCENYFELEVDN